MKMRLYREGKPTNVTVTVGERVAPGVVRRMLAAARRRGSRLVREARG